MLAILSVIDTIPIGLLISLFSQFLEKPATCDFGGCHGGGMSNRSCACGTAGIGGGTHRYNCGQGGGTPECNSVSMASAVPEALISEVAPGPDWVNGVEIRCRARGDNGGGGGGASTCGGNATCPTPVPCMAAAGTLATYVGCALPRDDGTLRCHVGVYRLFLLF